MLTTQTELNAVNQMLSAIGSDPVTTLDDSTDVDVINAHRILLDVSRHVQRQGWDFNKATKTYTPDVNTHRILWEVGVLSLKSNDNNTYVKRGKYIFNMTDGTYEFPEDIEVTVIYGLDFEDLPDCFKEYITAKAAIDFQSRYFGDSSVSQDLQYALQIAHQSIVQYDMDMQDVNILNLSGVSEVLRRT